jgi:PRTRC genetic system protein E
MIDFQKLVTVIPKDGMLKLLFTKKEDRITACIVLLFKGKEDNEHFSPVTLTGTAEELAEAFAKDIPEIANLSETLYERLKAPAVIANKKTTVTKAIAKTAPKDEKEKDKEKPVEMKAPPKPVLPPIDDLFGARPRAPESSEPRSPEDRGEEVHEEAAGGAL